MENVEMFTKEFEQQINYFSPADTSDEQFKESCKIALKLLAKILPQKITHEATKIESPTCPSCGNVVGKTERWGDITVNIQWNNCVFCGQALKWD